jgi:DNA repair protein RecO (recombination protein O)
MRSFSTEAIILRRTNYGEADKILSILTNDQGKLSVIAKGVRRPKSKLAGGLELFATCQLTIMSGRGEIGVVTSARLIRFYGALLHDYDRMMLGYECIKQLNKVTETVTEADFYYLLRDVFNYLDQSNIQVALIEIWFRLQLAQLLGRGLNLRTTYQGQRLHSDEQYNFDFQEMGFVVHPQGRFRADHIKVLRLSLIKNPAILQQVSGIETVSDDCLWLVRSLES